MATRRRAHWGSVVAAIVLLGCMSAAEAQDRTVRVGVLTRGSLEQTVRLWPPTVQYLTQAIPGHVFQLVPLGFQELGPAVGRHEVDFFITNSGSYVQLEMLYGASPIATLKNQYADHVYTTKFGGVILVRADRADITQLGDLRGKRFLAVDERSFGGWSMAWRELRAEGLDPDELGSVRFAGNHQDVVRAVHTGEVDAGTVRTGVLEQMALSGEIDTSNFRILRPAGLSLGHDDTTFPFLHSTRLYPEWPFARLPSTDDHLAEQVAVALLNMPPDSEAASAAQSVGWTVPLNYQPVHELMRELQIGLYADLESLTLADALRRHWHWVAALLAALLILSTTTWHVTRLNRSVVASKRELEREAQERSRAEQVLRQSEERFRNLVETTHDFIWETDRHGRFTYASPQIRALLGWEPGDLVGEHVDFLQDGPSDASTGMSLGLLHRQRPFVSRETACRHRSGQPVVLECSGVPYFDVRGGFQGFRGINRDITERKHSAEALFSEKERAQVTLDSIADGVIRTDADGRIEYLNKAAAQLCGWKVQAALNRPLGELLTLVDETTGAPLASPVDAAIRNGETTQPALNALLLQPDKKSALHLELRAAPIRDRQQRTIGAVLVFHDVSEIRRLTCQLAHQASHDALTGLLNRSAFEERLTASLDEAHTGNHHHVLCYLDLDQFKVVNDTSGHAAGDELLRVLAQRLQLAIRDGDVLARLGGDEFGILLRDCSTNDARDIAHDLCRLVGDVRLNWKGRMFRVGVSVGLVPIGPNSGSLTDLLSAADSACYVAKDRGRNRVHVFVPDDAALAEHHGQMQWVHRIKDALEEGRFRLYCEELVPLSSAADALRPFEILLRMVDENGKEVAPMQFIPAAERYHLMPAVDRWVLARTFELLGRAGVTTTHPPRVFAINLSGQSLSDDGFLNYVIARLDESGLSPESLCFEITETAAIANLQRAVRLITILKGMGCRFALDDFGTGVSSFAYLKTLPVDFLKIDGSFVNDFLDDPVDHAMVDAINQVGHVMGLRTVAECVDHETTLERVRALGVDYAQGHSLRPAVPLEQVLALGDPTPTKLAAGQA